MHSSLKFAVFWIEIVMVVIGWFGSTVQYSDSEKGEWRQLKHNLVALQKCLNVKYISNKILTTRYALVWLVLCCETILPLLKYLSVVLKSWRGFSITFAHDLTSRPGFTTDHLVIAVLTVCILC